MNIGRNKKIRNVTLGFFVLFLISLPLQNVFAEASGPPFDADLDKVWWNTFISDAVGGIKETLSEKAVDVMLAPFAVVTQITASLSALFVSASAFFLDTAITYSVVDMYANFEKVSGSIGEAWEYLRDLANIFFIFILLYLAIGTVLQLGFSTKRLLIRLIIIALLINFSFFFTKVIIDVSNVVTIGFYNKILVENKADSLSSVFMGYLKLQSSYNVLEVLKLNFRNVITGSFLTTIFNIVGTFVFAASAFLFVARYLILLILLVFSALAFAAMALPSDKYSSQWWSALWSQVIFAPAYMALLWVSLKILNAAIIPTNLTLASVMGAVQDSGNVAALPDSGQPLFNFVLATGFLLATMIMASRIGAAGGKAMDKWSRAAMGGAVFGGAALAGRQVIGRAGTRFLQSDKAEELREKAAKGDTGARLQLRTATAATKSSFDARSAHGIGGAITGAGLGKAEGKGGFEAYTKAREKKAEETGKSLAPSEKTIREAEIELEKAKRGEGIKSVENTQREVDQLKGVSVKEKAKRLHISEKEAKQKGIEADKSLASKRQEEFASTIEKSRFTDPTTRYIESAKVKKLAKGKNAKTEAISALKKLEEEGEFGEVEVPGKETKPEAGESEEGKTKEV
ncbi:MAG: hypothetical protein KAR00_03630 [Candidatus Pacebacteria bacterium]|nr:hypothetical protein [Candidatus Paceibacterota bacterium]